MFSELDERRRTALSGFVRLLTETADPAYCGTFGVECTVHKGELRTVRLPQTPVLDLPPVANEKPSTLRAM